MIQAGLSAVAQAGHAGLLGTVNTAVNGAVLFDTMANDPTPAVRTRGREGLDGALERIKHMRGSADHHGKGLVVDVAAGLARFLPDRVARVRG
jgi:hypothetical protein